MGHPDLPSRELQLLVPETLKNLGGSAHRSEIIEEVQSRSGLTQEQLDRRYDKSGQLIVKDRIGWTLSFLKKLGAVDNSDRGVWSITEVGRKLTSLDQIDDMAREVRSAESEQAKAQRSLQDPFDDETDDIDAGDPESQWQTDLLSRLTEMTPAAFERLTQRLLREAGLHDVEVLGKSGDGGLDGVGDYRLSLVSFPVYFQCKRYSGSVSASAVRDFRGAMSGRGEKGLLVTTGTFTRGARQEATRDGAPPVQLIDGDELCILLKNHKLGVTTKHVPQHEVDTAWFDQFESP